MMRPEELTGRVREIVATIFDVPLDQVSSASSPDTIERWDSLGRLLLTLELEQEFELQLPPEQTERLTTIGEIVAVLEMHGVGLQTNGGVVRP